jgi:hypothetical protein
MTIVVMTTTGSLILLGIKTDKIADLSIRLIKKDAPENIIMALRATTPRIEILTAHIGDHNFDDSHIRARAAPFCLFWSNNASPARQRC